MSRHPCALAFVVALVATPAWADSAEETERAERLFREASTLVEKGDYAAACPKLEQSQRLDPALGTQYNLALCYEKIGRVGSAWRNLRSVARLARASGKKGREEIAQRMLDDLRPRVPHLVFTTHEPVTVTVDGERVEPDDLTFYAVDAGEHAIEASGPARTTWNKRISVTGEAQLDVPVLKRAEGAPIVMVERPSGRRTLGYALGGVGIAGVVAAAITGILILHDKSVADDRCTPICVDDEGSDAVRRGRILVPMNYVAWGLGAAGLGLGAYFLFSRPSQRSPALSLGPTGLRGTF